MSRSLPCEGEYRLRKVYLLVDGSVVYRQGKLKGLEMGKRLINWIIVFKNK
jgi:hypothetical protein